MIIPGVWIFSIILNIPLFLVMYFDKKSKSCADTWPEKWMAKGLNLTYMGSLSSPFLYTNDWVILQSRVHSVVQMWWRESTHPPVKRKYCFYQELSGRVGSGRIGSGRALSYGPSAAAQMIESEIFSRPAYPSYKLGGVSGRPLTPGLIPRVSIACSD